MGFSEHVHQGNRIEVTTNSTETGYWLASAHIRYGSDRITIQVMPSSQPGYNSENEALERTVAEARAWLDGKLGRR